MTDEQYITQLLDEKKETDFVDIKEKYYDDEKKFDLIKDIVSFANNCSYCDKYIVFGIVNHTWEIKGVSLETIPDVSNIITFLNTYVEPFVDVELGNFSYNNKDCAYIKIPIKGIDRPYIIKKEYARYGKTQLRAGEIYIRKNASNFIAERRDIDQIYRAKGNLNVSMYSDVIDIGEVQVSKSSKILGQISVVLSNTFSYSININDIKIDLISDTGTVQFDALFFEDSTKKFSTIPLDIKKRPILLDSGMERQKSLYFVISKEYIDILKMRSLNNYRVKLLLRDINGYLYVSNEFPISINIYGNAAI